MNYSKILFTSIFLFFQIIGFAQILDKNFNQSSLPIIQFDPNINFRFDSSNITYKNYIRLNNQYDDFFKRYNPNAVKFPFDVKFLKILEKNNAALVPIFTEKNLKQLSLRIDKSNSVINDASTNCNLTSLVNYFSVCILNKSDNTITCCDTTLINRVIAELILYKRNSITFESNAIIKNSKTFLFQDQLNKPVFIKKSVAPRYCSGYRYITKIDKIKSENGGLGENATITIIESDNLSQNSEFCSTNLALINPNTFIRTSTNTNFKNHVQKDLSIIFDDVKGSKCTPIGTSPQAIINNIFLMNGDCQNVNDFSGYEQFNALLSAILKTPAYGVILIEFGFPSNQNPAEWLKVNFELIKLATQCLNIIVIEPAGNGGFKLPEYSFLTPTQTSRSKLWKPDSTDSGAIMVGGANKNYNQYSNTYSPSLSENSNYGNRIDCYGIGEYVCTNYGSHNGTSAASAIIAGMVVDIQSIAFGKGRYLTPHEMRELFRKPTRRLVTMPESGLENKYIQTGDILLQNLDCLLGLNTNCPPCCTGEK